MKHFITWCCTVLNIGLLTPSINAQSGYAPPCYEVKQVKIDTDQTKQQILSDFIHDCERNHWRNDKGVVLLREYQNEQGNQCWLLLPSIDDAYKDNPPNRFASFRGDIILVFDADSKLNVKAAQGDKNALNECLGQIIGDRVYTRPIIRSRWTDNVLPITNRKLKEGARRTTAQPGIQPPAQ